MPQRSDEGRYGMMMQEPSSSTVRNNSVMSAHRIRLENNSACTGAASQQIQTV